MERKMPKSSQVDVAQKSDSKKPYVKPVLTVHGLVAQMTEHKVGTRYGSVLPIFTSDRGQKENFASVDVQAILDGVDGLTLESWNYKADDRSVRHLGPMAQDFAKAFGLGDSDKQIHAVDASGVALAAVQALYQMVREQQERIASLEAEVREFQVSPLAV